MIPARELTALHGNRMVFVLDFVGDDGERVWPTWDRMRMGDARRLNLMVYTCSVEGCDRVAAKLDHHAHYYQEMNRCRMHDLEGV